MTKKSSGAIIRRQKPQILSTRFTKRVFSLRIYKDPLDTPPFLWLVRRSTSATERKVLEIPNKNPKPKTKNEKTTQLINQRASS
jgi:hypothetical protein